MEWTRIGELARAMLTGETIKVVIPKVKMTIFLRFENFTPYGQAVPFGALPTQWVRLHLPTTAVLAAAYDPKSSWALRLAASFMVKSKK